MAFTGTRVSFCRFCSAGCGILVDIRDGRAVKVTGDRANPVHRGYTCPKGRELPAQHDHPGRLLRSRARRPDGTVAELSSGAAMDEIADSLREIVAEHGPSAVAAYKGTAAALYPAGGALMTSWLEALGSPLLFTPRSIDQPGKFVAAALAGRWEAGPQPFAGSDVWMLVGANPLVSMWGADFAPHNPHRTLADARRGGLRLIVVDPRRTETAAQADLHLRVRPGEDAALLAGMLRVILSENLVDHAFMDRFLAGVAELRAAVAPFTPDLVERRTGVGRHDIVEAARTFARGRRGCVSSGTGPDMSGRGTLTEYLIAALNLLCGRVLRAGEPVTNQHVLRPGVTPRARVVPPRPAAGFGVRMRSRDLTESVAGLPTAALADEILHDGPDRVRALVVNGGNPVAAWPDQRKTVAALQRLDLLVTIDPTLSSTARLAHYVIAPKLSLEVAGMTFVHENPRDYQGQSMGHPVPYGMYTPPVAEPPAGSDLLEEWEFFLGLGRRLGLALRLPGIDEPLDPHGLTSTDDVFALLTGAARVPLDEVRAHEHGALFPDATRVLPPEAGDEARIDLGNRVVLGELSDVLLAPAEPIGRDLAGRRFTHLLTSRRMRTSFNSSGIDLPALTRKGAFNPAYLHPDDCRTLGVHTGALLRISSALASTVAVVEEAADVLPGTVSLAHGWGGLPGEEHLARRRGTSTALLVSTTDMADPWSGIPRMSGVPVALAAVQEPNESGS